MRAWKMSEEDWNDAQKSLKTYLMDEKETKTETIAALVAYKMCVKKIFVKHFLHSRVLENCCILSSLWLQIHFVPYLHNGRIDGILTFRRLVLCAWKSYAPRISPPSSIYLLSLTLFFSSRNRCFFSSIFSHFFFFFFRFSYFHRNPIGFSFICLPPHDVFFTIRILD